VPEFTGQNSLDLTSILNRGFPEEDFRPVSPAVRLIDTFTYPVIHELVIPRLANGGRCCEGCLETAIFAVILT
jgi:hypothetical protein